MEEKEMELKVMMDELNRTKVDLQVKEKEMNHFRTLYEDSYE